jgi:hypothetical protein
MICRHLALTAVLLGWSAAATHAAYVDEILADSPVAYWRLNEKSDSENIVDVTGNVGPGTYEDLGGMEWGQAGAIVGDDDTAVVFQSANFSFACNGACGSGQVNPGGVLDLGTIDSDQALTLEAWFKIFPSVNEALPPTSFPRIFHYNNFDSGQYAFGVVGNDSAGFPQRTVWAGRGDGGDSGGVILSAEDDVIEPSDDEQWYHFVAQLDGAEVRLFLNGQELADLVDSDPIAWQEQQGTIGARINTGGDTVQPFPGLIDELAIYDKLLSPERVMAHYQAGLGQLAEPGDFNADGVLNAADIDDLTTQSAGGTNPAAYDLNADALVNDADVAFWIRDLFNSWVGDADLNGEFNSTDLVNVLASGTYEVDVASVWTSGDFNGDGRTNSGDLVAALADGGYEAGPRAAVAAVPEPSGVILLSLCGLALTVWARRQ